MLGPSAITLLKPLRCLSLSLRPQANENELCAAPHRQSIKEARVHAPEQRQTKYKFTFCRLLCTQQRAHCNRALRVDQSLLRGWVSELLLLRLVEIVRCATLHKFVFSPLADPPSRAPPLLNSSCSAHSCTPRTTARSHSCHCRRETSEIETKATPTSKSLA